MALIVKRLLPSNVGGVQIDDFWQEWFLENKDGLLLDHRGLSPFWREVGTTDEGIPLSALVSDF